LPKAARGAHLDHAQHSDGDHEMQPRGMGKAAEQIPAGLGMSWHWRVYPPWLSLGTGSSVEQGSSEAMA